ncbi:MAG: hypothetical protein HY812_11360 [Planctomycetes bacterium]|nr:hypothetical protein [Planctomycetota bacterium]
MPVHQGRVSPLFDAARRALLVEIERGLEVSRVLLALPGTGVADQVRAIADSGAEAVVCGAISGWAEQLLLTRRLRVFSGVAGEAEAVIGSIVDQGAPDERFRMPGCPRRRRWRRCRRTRPNFGE